MNAIESYFKLPLRDLIHQYPLTGKILREYGINCLACALNSCLVSDLFFHHQLNPNHEQALMEKLKAVIPADRLLFPTDTDKEKFSPPLRELFTEHKHIQLLLNLIPAIIEQIDQPYDKTAEAIVDVIDFIENYADKVHHAKEENILFKYFDDQNPLIQSMYLDHQQGRTLRLGIQKGLINNQKEMLADNLLRYKNLLSDHITRENDIVFPWIEANLIPAQIQEISERFYQADRMYGTMSRHYIGLLNRLIKKYPQP